MGRGATPPDSVPGLDDSIVDELLASPEGAVLETKRVGDNTRKIQTVVAFANTEGGLLVLGVEDAEKAVGRDRVFGIDENPESVDDLRRLLTHRITPPLAEPNCPPESCPEIPCTLRDGSRGSVVVVRADKSNCLHSVVDGGTYGRFFRSNRQLSAVEIAELSMRRGTTSAVSRLAPVPFDLLDTPYWRDYASKRRITGPISDAMRRLGLAREDDGAARPTFAAVLLFAEEPSGLLDSKASIRIFHYKGDRIERTPDTNLVRPPRTISGPLIAQIREATKAVIDELASGVQVGPLGFQVVQRYPVRVIQEAITNAVLHRDYRLASDVLIRIFSDRIEVESPGSLPGRVTVADLGFTGSHPRNRAIVDRLREFPDPPNIDAGEGVRMMRATMDRATLYPPIFLTQPDIPGECVVVYLFNESRPTIWGQVAKYLEAHGRIGNAEVRQLLQSDDPVRASKLLKAWVQKGLLVVVDPKAAKQHRRYRLPGRPPEMALFSGARGKQVGGSTKPSSK